MSRMSPILLLMSLAVAGGTIAAAQDATATPPKVLQISREWLKPGKSGMVHDKSEAAFVAASNRAKLQGHYVALNSISGKSRALYVYRYPSFAAMEEDQKVIDKNASFTADFDHAALADGDLLEGVDTAVLVYNEEFSYHPRPDLSHARYYEITAFHVKPGHLGDWAEIVKMYKAACDKLNRGDHWAIYELQFGGEAGTFISLTHRDSLAEVDKMLAGGANFVEAMGGDEAMHKFDELVSRAVDPWHTELFSINAKQSYPEDSWVKADPEFWKPKMKAPEAATAKPAAPKPTPASAAKPGGR